MSLKDVFEKNPNRRYIMFGGKGGLGKTTFSAATAYWLAASGKKVLVFSVDPQASLTDIFQQDIFGKGPVKIMENLWAQEIDADSHIKAYQNEIRKKILDMYGFEAVPDEIEHYIQAATAEPAMEESAIFDAVVDIVVKGDYDYYIYDLVPLGHALYYLSHGQGLRRVDQQDHQAARGDARVRGDGLAYEAREGNGGRPDPDRAAVHQDPHQRLSRILTDKEKTAFFFVVIPEEMIILDTLKAAELFAKFDVPDRAATSSTAWCPRELLQQKIPAYLTQPHRDAGQVPGADQYDVRQPGARRVCRSWNAT